MKISLNPPYIPLVQKPCCCNVTCLQMILYRRGFGLFDQQMLAQYFKIKIGKDDLKCFNIKLTTFTKTNFDEGLKTIESAGIVNRFFKAQKISLMAKAIRASEIKNLETFIIQNLKQNNDLWVEYKSHKTHGEKFIHDNVVESVVKTKKTVGVILIDPAPYHKPRLSVSLEKLTEAISKKYGRETGFIVISSTK